MAVVREAEAAGATGCPGHRGTHCARALAAVTCGVMSTKPKPYTALAMPPIAHEYHDGCSLLIVQKG